MMHFNNEINRNGAFGEYDKQKKCSQYRLSLDFISTLLGEKIRHQFEWQTALAPKLERLVLGVPRLFVLAVFDSIRFSAIKIGLHC